MSCEYPFTNYCTFAYFFEKTDVILTMTIKQGELLSTINSTADLRRLEPRQLPQLCDEIRQFIIDVVCINPGHLGASLGTVEMAVAIHYVFDTPSDKLIWDV
jgi:1-deoxy-D-xylulose-5-phosphate synthase